MQAFDVETEIIHNGKGEKEALNIRLWELDVRVAPD